MGQRTNLIILKGNKYELYYDHWCANSLDSYLFWGAKAALKFFRDHEKQGDNWWLDTVWCEGGAVIDLNKKVLLWFGGEDICYDIPLRRLFLELMQKNWKGYEIRWAYEGIADLADYVGYDRNKVIAQFSDKNLFTSDEVRQLFIDSDSLEYWDSIISVCNESNSNELYKINKSACIREFLYLGSEIVKLRYSARFLVEYTDGYDESNMLNSGVHIDLVHNELHIWTCYEEIFDLTQLQAVWIGYKIFCHKDKFEIHSELTDGQLRFVERNREDLIGTVKSIVCRDEKDPIDTINSLVIRLSEQGKDVKISSAAFIASKFESDKKSQEKLFDKRFRE